MSNYLLAIDQGTTNSRAIIFNEKAELISQHEMSVMQYYPQDGWVEQSAEELWSNTLECCRQAIKKINLSAKEISAIGISNQRETTIVWDKKTGQPIYHAIVWQDRRTAEYCQKFSEHKISRTLHEKTGLLLDPYFSASKIVWILNHVPGARLKAEQGELAFGTVDTFLLWHLTGGKSHLTDASNASRTLLFNIRTQQWDQDILEAFAIPAVMLPTVLDNAADFGKTHVDHFGHEILIAAMIGDQQAATVGQACFQPGMVKATFGTGAFMLLNTGKEIIHSKNKLLSTIAYRLKGEVTYGLEGSVFSAGTIVKWLRDSLKLIHSVSETQSMAEKVPNTGGVYFVPAFTGLGAPYWDPDARAAILGLTGNTSVEHIVRAALESVCYQTRDLLECMKLDGVNQLEALRVDGGMAVNDWLLQFLADTLNVTVQRPGNIETTALGAAFLAGLEVGLFSSLEEIAAIWKARTTFLPQSDQADRETLYKGWKNAVARIKNA